MKAGRPTKFTPKIADLICDGLANGKSLVRILKHDESLPIYSTVANWLLRGEKGEKPFKEFLDMYVQAREIQSDYLADEILDISDDSSNDTRHNKNGDAYCDHEWVQRSKLRVDARKWVAARLRPRKYGEFNRSELTGANGGPLESQSLFIIDAGDNPYKSK